MSMSITYQHPHTKSSTGFEVVEVASHHVACQGEGGALGHPHVYLELDRQSGRAVCPYCSKHFVYSHYKVF